MRSLVNRSYVSHDFYCINCGNRTMTLPRSKSKLKERFHRKVLYCPYCKREINQIECRNDTEVFNFKQDFESGKYVEEAKESMAYVDSNTCKE